MCANPTRSERRVHECVGRPDPSPFKPYRRASTPSKSRPASRQPAGRSRCARSAPGVPHPPKPNATGIAVVTTMPVSVITEPDAPAPSRTRSARADLRALEVDQGALVVQRLAQLAIARISQVALRLQHFEVVRHTDFELA